MGLKEAHMMMCIAGHFNGHVVSAETGEEEPIGDSEEGKEKSRGLRAAKIGYYKWVGRGKNILQEAGNPHQIEVASIKQKSTCC